jgi:hypothetical protein
MKQRYSLVLIGVGIFFTAWAVLGATKQVESCISPSLSDQLGNLIPLIKGTIGLALLYFGLTEFIGGIHGKEDKK